MLNNRYQNNNLEAKSKPRQKKISLKIKKIKNGESSVEPIESIWNELRHTQSTITYIKSLIDDQSGYQSKYQDVWHQEINKQKVKLLGQREYFCRIYSKIRCILEEFEIRKYDKMYLEIMFTKSI